VDRCTSRESLGVYVHIPFCERVCPYCDFAVEGVGSVTPEGETEYVNLLLRELDRVCRKLPERLVDRPLSTVYLGGGTPSLLSPGAVERLLEALRARFRGDPEEVTLELNPGTAECARIPAFRAAGVTRLSVGLQSFDNMTLKRLGRAHKGDEALRGLEACLGAGFRSVSVDLIYGAPGQTEWTLRADVSRVCELAVPHVSAYGLTVEPGTPFAGAQERGLLRLPDEDVALRMMGSLRAELVAAGYAQYEISNFAWPAHESRHNLRYWRREDVLGLGVSSASLLGDLRTRNLRTRQGWAQAIGSGGLAWEERERLSPLDTRRETLFLGFRMTRGIGRADYLRLHGGRPEDEFGPELAELRELGLIEDCDGQLRATEKGRLFSNEIGIRFVAVDPPDAGG
jgi:oxygen-independent coproporphyrinogen-3 oxidase